MKNMNDRNNRNNKVMDIILEAATDKYAQDIANEMVECNMTAEEDEIMLNQQTRVYQNIMKQIRKEEKHHCSAFKKCTILAASLASIIVLAANVSAFRIFIFKTYTNISETFLNVKTEKVTKENYNTIIEFEYKDEIIIPGWLPPELSLRQITDDYTGIKLEYQSDNLWLTIDENTIDSIGSDDSIGSETQIETNNNVYKVEDNKILDMNGVTIEIRSETGNNIFIVNWNSDNICYELSTNSSKIMLDTLLQHLKYLK